MSMVIYPQTETPVLRAAGVGAAPAYMNWGWNCASARTAAWFEYVGRTALVVTGPYTGHRYHFSRPGARLAVDLRDRHALQAVPVLRPL